MTKEARSTIYVQQSGAGARINVNSTDTSVNVVSIAEDAVFPRLRNEIEANVKDSLKRQQYLSLAPDELEQSKGSPSYAAKFKDFISVTADLMTIIGPFIQPLTALIK